MSERRIRKPAFATATCAALIAASLAAPVSADAINSIERYCTISWRQAGIPDHDWDDCTQDTMLELLSRLPGKRFEQAIENASSPERRELMRSVWAVAQRWRRAARRSPVSLDVVQSQVSADAPELPGDAEALAQALENLNDTQQKIISLWLDGNTVAEISDQLKITAARVSDQKYKAIRSLKRQLSDTEAAA